MPTPAAWQRVPGHTPGRAHQLLYLVLFICQRALWAVLDSNQLTSALSGRRSNQLSYDPTRAQRSRTSQTAGDVYHGSVTGITEQRVPEASIRIGTDDARPDRP